MSDYKRFVSYIYGYNQGEKGENTGFVKVNARGGECKIWVHVKGFYTHRQKPYRVYVFAQKKEWLEGQYLGELESRNGALEWNGVTRTDSLMGGFSLDESRGIYIEGENRVLAAEWDDYPVDVERFHPLERYARQRNRESGGSVPGAGCADEGRNGRKKSDTAGGSEKETMGVFDGAFSGIPIPGRKWSDYDWYPSRKQRAVADSEGQVGAWE